MPPYQTEQSKITGIEVQTAEPKKEDVAAPINGNRGNASPGQAGSPAVEARVNKWYRDTRVPDDQRFDNGMDMSKEKNVFKLLGQASAAYTAAVNAHNAEQNGKEADDAATGDAGQPLAVVADDVVASPPAAYLKLPDNDAATERASVLARYYRQVGEDNRMQEWGLRDKGGWGFDGLPGLEVAAQDRKTGAFYLGGYPLDKLPKGNYRFYESVTGMVVGDADVIDAPPGSEGGNLVMSAPSGVSFGEQVSHSFSQGLESALGAGKFVAGALSDNDNLRQEAGEHVQTREDNIMSSPALATPPPILQSDGVHVTWQHIISLTAESFPFLFQSIVAGVLGKSAVQIGSKVVGGGTLQNRLNNINNINRLSNNTAAGAAIASNAIVVAGNTGAQVESDLVAQGVSPQVAKERALAVAMVAGGFGLITGQMAFGGRRWIPGPLKEGAQEVVEEMGQMLLEQTSVGQEMTQGDMAETAANAAIGGMGASSVANVGFGAMGHFYSKIGGRWNPTNVQVQMIKTVEAEAEQQALENGMSSAAAKEAGKIEGGLIRFYLNTADAAGRKGEELLSAFYEPNLAIPEGAPIRGAGENFNDYRGRLAAAARRAVQARNAFPFMTASEEVKRIMAEIAQTGQARVGDAAAAVFGPAVAAEEVPQVGAADVAAAGGKKRRAARTAAPSAAAAGDAVVDDVEAAAVVDVGAGDVAGAAEAAVDDVAAGADVAAAGAVDDAAGAVVADEHPPRPADAERTPPASAEGEIREGEIRKLPKRLGGFSLNIENPKGSTRSGVGADGEVWSVEMPVAYGEIRGTTAEDNEGVDVFVGDDVEGGNVYLINQVRPGTKDFDENKIMLGFDSEAAAEQAYKDSYADGFGDEVFGGIVQVAADDFVQFVKNYKVKKKDKQNDKKTGQKKAEAKTAAPQPSAERDAGRDDDAPAADDDNNADGAADDEGGVEARPAADYKMKAGFDDVDNPYDQESLDIMGTLELKDLLQAIQERIKEKRGSLLMRGDVGLLNARAQVQETINNRADEEAGGGVERDDQDGAADVAAREGQADDSAAELAAQARTAVDKVNNRLPPGAPVKKTGGGARRRKSSSTGQKTRTLLQRLADARRREGIPQASDDERALILALQNWKQRVADAKKRDNQELINAVRRGGVDYGLPRLPMLQAVVDGGGVNSDGLAGGFLEGRDMWPGKKGYIIGLVKDGGADTFEGVIDRDNPLLKTANYLQVNPDSEGHAAADEWTITALVERAIDDEMAGNAWRTADEIEVEAREQADNMLVDAVIEELGGVVDSTTTDGQIAAAISKLTSDESDVAAEIEEVADEYADIDFENMDDGVRNLSESEADKLFGVDAAKSPLEGGEQQTYAETVKDIGDQKRLQKKIEAEAAAGLAAAVAKQGRDIEARPRGFSLTTPQEGVDMNQGVLLDRDGNVKNPTAAPAAKVLTADDVKGLLKEEFEHFEVGTMPNGNKVFVYDNGEIIVVVELKAGMTIQEYEAKRKYGGDGGEVSLEGVGFHEENQLGKVANLVNDLMQGKTPAPTDAQAAKDWIRDNVKNAVARGREMVGWSVNTTSNMVSKEDAAPATHTSHTFSQGGKDAFILNTINGDFDVVASRDEALMIDFVKGAMDTPAWAAGTETAADDDAAADDVATEEAAEEAAVDSAQKKAAFDKKIKDMSARLQQTAWGGQQKSESKSSGKKSTRPRATDPLWKQLTDEAQAEGWELPPMLRAIADVQGQYRKMLRNDADNIERIAILMTMEGELAEPKMPREPMLAAITKLDVRLTDDADAELLDMLPGKFRFSDNEVNERLKSGGNIPRKRNTLGGLIPATDAWAALPAVGGFLTDDGVMDALEAERAGNPLRTAKEREAIAKWSAEVDFIEEHKPTIEKEIGAITADTPFERITAAVRALMHGKDIRAMDDEADVAGGRLAILAGDDDVEQDQDQDVAEGNAIDSLNEGAGVVDDNRPAVATHGEVAAMADVVEESPEVVLPPWARQIVAYIDGGGAAFKRKEQLIDFLGIKDQGADIAVFYKNLYEQAELAVNFIISRDGITDWRRAAELAAILPTQAGKASAEQKALQQYSTPPPFAALAAAAVQIGETELALEPSAGNGGLAAFLPSAQTEVNEIDASRRANLKFFGFHNVLSRDGEQISAAYGRRWDVVLMNPPFSASLTRSKDSSATERHTQAAMNGIKAGGRLVIISGENFKSSAPAHSDFFAKAAKNGFALRASIRVPGELYARQGASWPLRVTVWDYLGDAAGAVAADDVSVVGREEGDIKSYDDLEAAVGEIHRRVANVNEAPAAVIADNTVEQTAVDMPPLRKGAGGRQKNRASTEINTTEVSARQRVTADDYKKADAGVRIPQLPKGGPGRQAGEASDSESRTVYHTRVAGAEHPIPLDTTPPLASIEPPELGEGAQKAYAALPTPQGNFQPSGAQIEEVLRAFDAWEQFFEGDGGVQKRMGYMSGAGTGVGKSVMAAMAIGTARRLGAGRGRSVVLSKSWALFNGGDENGKKADGDETLLGGAKLAFSQMGMDPGTLLDWRRLTANDTLENGETIFATYGILGSGAPVGGNVSDLEGREIRGKNLARMVELLGEGYDGLFIFDESHEMANGNPVDKNTKPSQQGIAGIALQNKFPKARILYLSGTALKNTSALAYADRMNLYGVGRPFETLDKLRSALDEYGISLMELVAQDSRRRGLFNQMSLSGTGIEYENLIVDMDEDAWEMIKASSKVWRVISDKEEDIIANMVESTIGSKKGGAAKGKLLGRARGQLAIARRDYFMFMLSTLTAPAVADAAVKAIKDGYRVLFQTGPTYDEQMKRQVDAQVAAQKLSVDAEGFNANKVDLAPTGIIEDYLKSSFSTYKMEAYQPPKKDGQKEESPQEMRPLIRRTMIKGDLVPVLISDVKPQADGSTELYTTMDGQGGISEKEIRIEDLAPNETVATNIITAKRVVATIDTESMKARDDLLKTVRTDIKNVISKGPMDIIHSALAAEFGGRQGGEISGRKYHQDVVSKGWQDEFRIRARKPKNENTISYKDWRQGKKDWMVFSVGAGGTGIDLHSDKKMPGEKKRIMHFLIGFSDNTTNEMQALGRSHRAGQFMPPKYVLTAAGTNLSVRYIANIAAALKTMGALSSGAKSGMSGGVIKDDMDIQDKWLTQGIKLLSQGLASGQNPFPELEGLSAHDLFENKLALRAEVNASAKGNNNTPNWDNLIVTPRRFLNAMTMLIAERELADKVFDRIINLRQQAIEDAGDSAQEGAKVMRGEKIEILSVRDLRVPERPDGAAKIVGVRLTQKLPVYAEDKAKMTDPKEASGYQRYLSPTGLASAIYTGVRRVDSKTGKVYDAVLVRRPFGTAWFTVQEWANKKENWTQIVNDDDVAVWRDGWQEKMDAGGEKVSEKIMVTGDFLGLFGELPNPGGIWRVQPTGGKEMGDFLGLEINAASSFDKDDAKLTEFIKRFGIGKFDNVADDDNPTDPAEIEVAVKDKGRVLKLADAVFVSKRKMDGIDSLIAWGEKVHTKKLLFTGNGFSEMWINHKKVFVAPMSIPLRPMITARHARLAPADFGEKFSARRGRRGGAGVMPPLSGMVPFMRRVFGLPAGANVVGADDDGDLVKMAGGMERFSVPPPAVAVGGGAYDPNKDPRKLLKGEDGQIIKGWHGAVQAFENFGDKETREYLQKQVDNKFNQYADSDRAYLADTYVHWFFVKQGGEGEYMARYWANEVAHPNEGEVIEVYFNVADDEFADMTIKDKYGFAHMDGAKMDKFYDEAVRQGVNYAYGIKSKKKMSKDSFEAGVMDVSSLGVMRELGYKAVKVVVGDMRGRGNYEAIAVLDESRIVNAGSGYTMADMGDVEAERFSVPLGNKSFAEFLDDVKKSGLVENGGVENVDADKELSEVPKFKSWDEFGEWSKKRAAELGMKYNGRTGAVYNSTSEFHAAFHYATSILRTPEAEFIANMNAHGVSEGDKVYRIFVGMAFGSTFETKVTGTIKGVKVIFDKPTEFSTRDGGIKIKRSAFWHEGWVKIAAADVDKEARRAGELFAAPRLLRADEEGAALPLGAQANVTPIDAGAGVFVLDGLPLRFIRGDAARGILRAASKKGDDVDLLSDKGKIVVDAAMRHWPAKADKWLDGIVVGGRRQVDKQRRLKVLHDKYVADAAARRTAERAINRLVGEIGGGKLDALGIRFEIQEKIFGGRAGGSWRPWESLARVAWQVGGAERSKTADGVANMIEDAAHELGGHGLWQIMGRPRRDAARKFARDSWLKNKEIRRRAELSLELSVQNGDLERGGDDYQAALEEEAFALALGMFARARYGADKANDNLRGGRRLLARILDAIEALGRWLRQRFGGEWEARDLFDAVLSGQVAKEAAARRVSEQV